MVFILLIPLCQELSWWTKLIPCLVFMTGFAAYMMAVRPFDSWKDNMIEIISVCVFVFMTFLLSIWRNQQAWPGWKESMTIMFLIIINMVIAVISFIDFAVNLLSASK